MSNQNDYVIKSNDPNAIALLTERLNNVKSRQVFMHQANAYYQENGTLAGFENVLDGVTPEWVDKKMADIEKYENDKPYTDFMLRDVAGKIKHYEERIKNVEYEQNVGFNGWEFDGGKAVANKADNMLQLQFDDKPDKAIRDALKGVGFNWNGEEKGWERQLTQNAINACDKFDFLKTTDGKKPSDVQPKPPQRDNSDPER